MKELQTFQQENKLNDVFAVDELGPSGAHHRYTIARHGILYVDALDKCLSTEPRYEGPEPVLHDLYFQCGPRNDPKSNPGITDSDLLEIVRDRLTDFQNGPFACQENSDALVHVTAALAFLNNRTQKRAKRGVLGTDTP